MKLLTYPSLRLGLELRLCLGLREGRVDHIPVADIIGGFCEITHLLLPWVRIRVKTMFRLRGEVGWVISQKTLLIQAETDINSLNLF